LRFPRPCRFVARRFVFAREFAVGQTLPADLSHGELEALAVVQVFAVVVPESLFVKVTEKMKRFDTHIRATDAELEKRPEVLQPVRVDAPVNVLDGVVNDLVGVISGQSVIGTERIGVKGRASFDMLSDFALQSMFLAIGNNRWCESFHHVQESPSLRFCLSYQYQ